MQIEWIDTELGPWPAGTIDPVVLKEWYMEEPFDAVRQCVCSSIVNLIQIIREMENEANKI